MTATIISGKEIAAQIEEELKAEIEELKAKGIVPGLAVVLVGDDPASQIYVRSKEKKCAAFGIHSEVYRLPKETSEKELLTLIDGLNNKPAIHGILVQSPVPSHISEMKVIESINPKKDVDGFHPISVGRLVAGEDTFVSCTPQGVMEMLMRSGNDPAGKHAVVVGRSNIVGKPMANLLVQKAKGANATVTICHSRTQNLPEITRQADILIAAIGLPEFIKADMVKDGAVVIDVGINRVDDPTREKGYRVVGDVDFEAVKEKAGAISPVPGGVGPMTIIILMKNTVKAARRALR